jgi:hypothetical protein
MAESTKPPVAVLTTRIGLGTAVFRFSLREMLWLTLVVAVVTAWRIEGVRAERWKSRAEFAVNQLELESLEQMALNDRGVFLKAPSYEAPLSHFNGPASR